MRLFFLSVVAAMLIATAANADVVTFKNGDRLSGRWARVVGGDLVFNSDSVGAVTVPLGKIDSFSSTQPAVAMLTNGKMLRGLVFLLPTGDWQFAVENGLKTVKAGNVVAILPEKTFVRLGGERHTRLWYNWKGAASFGYSIERGDTRAGTISTNVTADRLQPNLPGVQTRWRTHYNLQMLFAHAETVATGATISSNTFTSGLRQDYLFTRHNFVYGEMQFDHIQPQDLALRQTYGGGFGEDVRRTSRMTFSVLGGLTYVNEEFHGAPRRQNIEGFTGERLTYVISNRVHLNSKVDLYPNITSAGEFRGDASAGIDFRLTNRLSMNTSVVDFYLARPPTGSKNNNFTATTGLGINF